MSFVTADVMEFRCSSAMSLISSPLVAVFFVDRYLFDGVRAAHGCMKPFLRYACIYILLITYLVTRWGLPYRRIPDRRMKCSNRKTYRNCVCALSRVVVEDCSVENGSLRVLYALLEDR
ncbi:hypothetical protein EDD16DRAFT_575195 [Pisolithus croceorrhizus]|nr:hypothetical protein EV401DRAFT_1388771 [Pisolithus croceorrhizus]KAI6124182.1 hypothetical protein EDD16DRAFT_575195 [Pisolithus croceorrhizus]